MSDECACCAEKLDVERKVYPSPRGIICTPCQLSLEAQAEMSQLSLLAAVMREGDRR
jgi:hypothetical protein